MSVVGFIPATARPDTEALAIAFGRSTGAGQRAGVTGTGHTVEWPFILFGDVFLAVPSRGIGRSEGIKAGIGAHGSISLATEGLDATGGRSADRDTATALEELSNQLVSLGLDFTLVHGLSFSLSMVSILKVPWNIASKNGTISLRRFIMEAIKFRYSRLYWLWYTT